MILEVFSNLNDPIILSHKNLIILKGKMLRHVYTLEKLWEGQKDSCCSEPH